MKRGKDREEINSKTFVYSLYVADVFLINKNNVMLLQNKSNVMLLTSTPLQYGVPVNISSLLYSL